MSVAALLLAGCSVSVAPDNQAMKANASELAVPAHWTNATRAQLRQAIEERAVHGLDKMPFTSDATNEAGFTRQALAYASALAQARPIRRSCTTYTPYRAPTRTLSLGWPTLCVATT
jgi:L,D-transpeptidase YcbB